MKKALALTLALLLPLAAAAQAIPPLSPSDEEMLPIDPGLRKKTVLIRLRDGRTFQGKLKEIAADSLVLEVRDFDTTKKKKVKRLQSINRVEVVWVEKVHRSYSRLWGLAFGVGAIVIPIAIAFAVTDKNKT